MRTNNKNPYGMTAHEAAAEIFRLRDAVKQYAEALELLQQVLLEKEKCLTHIQQHATND